MSGVLTRVSRLAPRQLVYGLNHSSGSESARQLVLRSLVEPDSGKSLWSALDAVGGGLGRDRQSPMPAGTQSSRTRQMASGNDEGSGPIPSSPTESPYGG